MPPKINRPGTSLSQEVVDSLGDFTEKVTSTLKTDVKTMLDSQSIILSERIGHLQAFTQEKFKHLEERQVAENLRLKEQIEDVKDQVSHGGKAYEEMTSELRVIKDDLSTVKGDLQRASDGTGIKSLREEVERHHKTLTEKIDATGKDLTEKIVLTNTRLDTTAASVATLTQESLVREGGRKVITAIYGAVGTTVIGGIVTLIYLAIKHWG